MSLALALSIVLHAVVLSVHFKLPETMRRLAPAQLEVVLVNSRTRSTPVRADVHAQANLDGGGDTDLDRRAKTPFPLLAETERGADAKRATRRVQELELRQKQLLAQVRTTKNVVPDNPTRRQSRPQVSGTELANSALEIARLEAQIARDIEEYNKRPKKLFIGARAAEVSHAMYVEDWRQKIERIGNLNYPEGARGRIYGSLRLTASINADGTLGSVSLDRSSGQKILDAAAERIVRLAAPYAKFPPEIRKNYDILVITRTWHFAPGDKVFSE